MKNHGNTVLIVEEFCAFTEALIHQIHTGLGLKCLHVTSKAEAELKIFEHQDEIFIALLSLNLPDAPNGEIVNYVLSNGIPTVVLTDTYNDNIRDSMMARPLVDYVIKRGMNDVQYIVDLIGRLNNNKNIKVLIVDPSSAQRMFLTLLLSNHCYKLIEASDGLDALKKFEEHPDIRLMLTVDDMPNMDGHDLIIKLRERYSRNELAIIGISSDESRKATIDLLKTGANDFISRPYINEELYCRINQNIDAIENFAQLRDAAIKDFLTDLYNRKYIFDTGGKLFHNALRKNIDLTAAMVDIDFFKKINDAYGHDVGDLALKHVSKILIKQLHEGDIVARMGGEEFCILCVNINNDNAEKLFERIRLAIQNTPFIENGTPIPISVSIGYSMKLGDSLDMMINDADSALYNAKETGRNKVVQFK